MFVAGVDGCRAGWVAFRVEVPSLATSVAVLDLPKLLSSRPTDLLCLAIDIPIGLDCSRACDKAARKLLGQPRGTSVFAAPCRAVLSATTHAAASQNNREKTGRGLSQQAFGIIPKIKQVDDAIRADCQDWVLEVHPEVCFWALNQRRAMAHTKKTKDGTAERITLLRHPFAQIERDLANRPSGVGGGRSAGCGSSRLDCAEMESQRSGICLLTGMRSEESRDDDLVLNDLLKAKVHDRMTDPTNALQSFQQALLHGGIPLQPGVLDRDLYVYFDRPKGGNRFTYVRLEDNTVTAFVEFASCEAIEGTPCFAIGYAVPEAHRNQGRAKNAIRAAISELQNGLGRIGLSVFYVEAIVGADNKPSQRVAEQVISDTPVPVTDQVSGLPAFRYVRKVEPRTSGL